MSFGARALVRLGALAHNLDVIRHAAPEAKVMAVVKANAYGHGLVPVAQHLAAVDAFAVARFGEAQLLRDAGIDKPCVLLEGIWDRAQLDAAAESAFDVVVHSDEQLRLLREHRGAPVVAWLKFDSGMGRLGFDVADAAALIETLSCMPAVGELRLMTHMACADEIDNEMTARQLDRFREVATGFEGDVSIANTPAALAWPGTARDAAGLGFRGSCWIRPGISLFGISPFADRTGADLGLEPVMTFEARLIAVKPLRAGATVGYQARYRAPADTTLGIIAAGYGDGYTRHFRDGTPVLVNGRRVPLIGNVSMDMIAVDLGTDATDAIGDVATLWGPELPVEEVAPWADAIPYELVCGIMNREESEVAVP